MRSRPAEESDHHAEPAATEGLADRRRRGAIVRNAVFGALLLAAALAGSLAFGWHGVAAQQRRRLPTEWLLTLVRFEPMPSGPLMGELLSRMSRGKVEEALLLDALEICLVDSAEVPLGSEAWLKRYGRLARLWQMAYGRPVEERRRLYEIPAQIDVTAPPVWPSDAPVALHLRILDAWPIETVCRVRVEVPGIRSPIVALRAAGEGGRRALIINLPQIPLDAETIDLRIHVDRRREDPVDDAPRSAEAIDPDSAWELVQSVDRSIGVGTRVPLESALRPRVDPRLDAAMARVFANGVLRWRDERARIAILFNPQAMMGLVSEDFAVGVRVELQERGETRRRSRLWWLVSDDRSTGAEWDPPEEDRDGLARLLALDEGDPALDDWRVVIVSDPELALRAFGSSESAAVSMTLPAQHWHGRVELPMSVQDRDEQTTPRAWWVLVDESAPNPVVPAVE